MAVEEKSLEANWGTQTDWNRMIEADKVDHKKLREWQEKLLLKVLEEQEKQKIENFGESYEMTESEYRRFLYDVIRTISDIPSIAHANLVGQFLDDAFRFGPVQPLWDREMVSDIQVFVPYDDQHEMIISYVERGKREIFKDAKFRDFLHAQDWVNHHLSRIGLRYDPSKIYINGTFPGMERIHVVSGPVGYSVFDQLQRTYKFVRCMIISIRRFVNSFTLEELTEKSNGQHAEPTYEHDKLIDTATIGDYDRKTVYTRFTGTGVSDLATMDLLRIMVLLQKNYLISGGTGAGKTTLANSLTSMIPFGTLLLVLEEAPEMQPMVEGHVIRLYERPGVFTMENGLVNALRMFPDRIFVSELRDAIAYTYVQAIQSGHDGSSSTIHAGSCIDAKRRTIELAAGHPSKPDRNMIESILRERLHFVIHCNRDSGDRFIDEICEINAETGELHVVSRFQQKGKDRVTGRPVGQFEFYGPSDRFINEMFQNGIDIPRSWKWRRTK